MTEWQCLLVGVVLVVAVLAANYVAVTRQERREGVQPNGFSPEQPDWGMLAEPEMQDFLTRGLKINAIKRYRERTGVGLKEAKDAIEYALAHPDEAALKKLRRAEDSFSDAGLRDLIAEGRLDEAAELYRQFAGVDEYTAREAVEEIARGMDQ